MFAVVPWTKSLMLRMVSVALTGITLLCLPADLDVVQMGRRPGGQTLRPDHMGEEWSSDHSADASVGAHGQAEDVGEPWFTSQGPPHTVSRGTGGPFGSRTILERLWTPDDWQGSPQAKGARRSPPDLIPPVRTVPTGSAPPLAPGRRNSIRRVRPRNNQKVIALTFDLCERADEVAGYDAPLVNFLRAAQVRATFFAGGKWLRSHAETAMQLMADPLFEVGNHGWTHGNLRVLTGARMTDQILWTQAQYELLWDELKTRARAMGIARREIENIPRRPLTFRFPYGTCSPEALHALATYGLPAIQWDVVSGDPGRNQTAPNIVRTVLSQTRPGSIVVFHANGRGYGTAEALPRLIPLLRERGFEFVTVSELLTLGEVIATPECYELSRGDNRRYDAMVGEGTTRK